MFHHDASSEPDTALLPRRRKKSMTDAHDVSVKEHATLDHHKQETTLVQEPLIERRRAPKNQQMRLAGELYVELTPFRDMSILRRAWFDLAERALERNIFYEPAFLEAAALHLPAGRHLFFVTVWAHKPSQTLVETRRKEDLLALFPVYWPKLGFIPHNLKGWSCPYSPLGTPLIDQTMARPALEACLDWLAKRGSRSVNLQLPFLKFDGPFVALLKQITADTKREIYFSHRHQRAILQKHSHTEEAQPTQTKKTREWARQRRRLEDLGTLKTERLHDPRSIRDGLEYFLALEASGWKGRDRSSLLQDPSTANFARAFIRVLSRSGHCRLDILKVDETLIASGIVLRAGNQSWYWKTAYDENYAKYSPGVILTRDITVKQLDNPHVDTTDSCAIENHPMIDVLWPDRLTMTHCILGTHTGTSIAATTARLHDEGVGNLRTITKKAYHKLRQTRS
jgi:CelD/BcsL family acetyltransferase involved in cellulose biosynthesis